MPDVSRSPRCTFGIGHTHFAGRVRDGDAFAIPSATSLTVIHQNQLSLSVLPLIAELFSYHSPRGTSHIASRLSGARRRHRSSIVSGQPLAVRFSCVVGSTIRDTTARSSRSGRSTRAKTVRTVTSVVPPHTDGVDIRTRERRRRPARDIPSIDRSSTSPPSPGSPLGDPSSSGSVSPSSPGLIRETAGKEAARHRRADDPYRPSPTQFHT